MCDTSDAPPAPRKSSGAERLAQLKAQLKDAVNQLSGVLALRSSVETALQLRDAYAAMYRAIHDTLRSGPDASYECMVCDALSAFKDGQLTSLSRSFDSLAVRQCWRACHSASTELWVPTVTDRRAHTHALFAHTVRLIRFRNAQHPEEPLRSLVVVVRWVPPLNRRGENRIADPELQGGRTDALDSLTAFVRSADTLGAIRVAAYPFVTQGYGSDALEVGVLDELEPDVTSTTIPLIRAAVLNPATTSLIVGCLRSVSVFAKVLNGITGAAERLIVSEHLLNRGTFGLALFDERIRDIPILADSLRRCTAPLAHVQSCTHGGGRGACTSACAARDLRRDAGGLSVRVFADARSPMAQAPASDTALGWDELTAIPAVRVLCLDGDPVVSSLLVALPHCYVGGGLTRLALLGLRNESDRGIVWQYLPQTVTHLRLSGASTTRELLWLAAHRTTHALHTIDIGVADIAAARLVFEAVCTDPNKLWSLSLQRQTTWQHITPAVVEAHALMGVSDAMALSRRVSSLHRLSVKPISRVDVAAWAVALTQHALRELSIFVLEGEATSAGAWLPLIPALEIHPSLHAAWVQFRDVENDHTQLLPADLADALLRRNPRLVVLPHEGSGPAIERNKALRLNWARVSLAVALARVSPTGSSTYGFPLLPSVFECLNTVSAMDLARDELCGYDALPCHHPQYDWLSLHPIAEGQSWSLLTHPSRVTATIDSTVNSSKASPEQKRQMLRAMPRAIDLVAFTRTRYFVRESAPKVLSAH